MLFQTAKKGKLEYVKGFGDILAEVVRDFSKSTENLESLTKLIKICDMWENELIFANNFMEYLRKIIRNRIFELDPNNEEIKSKSDPSESLIYDFRLINRWQICNYNFTLDLQEENIRYKMN